MWAQLLNAAVGIWLMVAPSVLGYGPPGATNDRIVGPFVAALAGVAVGQCTRNVRWWLLPFAAWLMIGPLVLDLPVAASVSDIASGILIVALACVRGRVNYSFGGGWAVLLRRSAA